MALDPAIRFILDWGHYCCSICKQIPPLRLETQNIRCLTGSMQARSRPLSKIWAVTALWHINTLDYDFCAGLQYHYREGNGTPLQYFCLENPMDRGAWWAAVHGVAKSGTWLSIFTFTFHFHALEKEMATHSSTCLENPRDRGAWWAAVYGVAQTWTRLKRLSSSSNSSPLCCPTSVLFSQCQTLEGV